MSSDPRFISDGIDSRDSESTLVSRPSRRAKSDCLEESKSGHNPKMKKEGRINVRYRVEMNILRAPSRLKAVWVTVITQTRMNGSKLINWIFNGVQQQFGLNEHFPMVPNSSLGMNLGSICTIQVLSIVRTGMYGVCLVWWRDRHLKPRVFKLEPLENILAIHKIIGNERKVKTIMLEHVLI